MPELWNPETGTQFDAPVWKQTNGIASSCTVNFEAYGSVFVVFRKTANSKTWLYRLAYKRETESIHFNYFFTKGDKTHLRLKEQGDYRTSFRQTISR